jgi:hypothetical protein
MYFLLKLRIISKPEAKNSKQAQNVSEDQAIRMQDTRDQDIRENEKKFFILMF